MQIQQEYIITPDIPIYSDYGGDLLYCGLDIKDNYSFWKFDHYAEIQGCRLYGDPVIYSEEEYQRDQEKLYQEITLLRQLTVGQQHVAEQSQFFYINFRGEKIYITEEEYRLRMENQSKRSDGGDALVQDKWLIIDENGQEV